MKQFNLQVVLLLGGILLFALGFQIFVGYSVENFAEAPATSQKAATSQAQAPQAPQAPPTDLGNVLAAQALYTKMPSADKKVLLTGVKSAIQLNAIGALDKMISGA